MLKVIDMRVRLPEEYRPKLVADDFYGRYDEVLNVMESTKKTFEDLQEEMKKTNVDFAVLHAEYEYGDIADELNESLGKLVAQHSQHFAGFGTVSLNKLNPMKLIQQARRIHELGLKGINLQPVFFGVDPLDPKLYPLYAIASELGLIITFHTGIHYSTKYPITKNNPIFIDQIACDFPEAKIIACHGGWPWINEMVAVARRHPNVYIEFGGVAPRYIGKQGTGWESLFLLMNNLLSDQILFGTDWPVLSLERAASEWKSVGLKEHTIEKLLSLNAMKLLHMEE